MCKRKEQSGQEHLIAADYTSKGSRCRSCSNTLVGSMATALDSLVFIVVLFLVASKEGLSLSGVDNPTSTDNNQQLTVLTAFISLQFLSMVFSSWQSCLKIYRLNDKRKLHQKLASQFFNNPNHTLLQRFEAYRLYVNSKTSHVSDFLSIPIVNTEHKKLINSKKRLKKINPVTTVNDVAIQIDKGSDSHDSDDESDELQVKIEDLLNSMDAPGANLAKIVLKNHQDLAAIVHKRADTTVSGRRVLAATLFRSAQLEKARRDIVAPLNLHCCTAHQLGASIASIISFILRLAALSAAFITGDDTYNKSSICSVGFYFTIGNQTFVYTEDNCPIKTQTIMIGLISLANILSIIQNSSLTDELQVVVKAIESYVNFNFIESRQPRSEVMSVVNI